MSAALDTILAVIAEPAMHALVHFLWQGSVVALVLGVVLLSLRRRSATARYQCACWALAIMVVLPVVTAVRYEWSETRIDPPVPVAGIEASPVADQSLDTRAAIHELARSSHQTNADGTSQIAGELLRQIAWDPQRDGIARWVLGLWLGGVFLLSVLHLGGWFRVQQLRSTNVETVPAAWQERVDELCRSLGIQRAVRLLQSSRVAGPMVVGYLRPVVLVPASALTGLPAQQLDCILAHELAHIWRRDYLVNLLQIVAETLLFYHPAVWWVSRQIRAERENSCDDIAVELAGDKLAYARALVDLEELRLASPRMALGAGDGPLLRRIQRLVGGPDMSMYSSRNLLAGTLAALVILIGGAVLALAAQERLGEVVSMATESEEEATLRGGWSAERYNDELHMEIRERGTRDGRHRGRWNMTIEAAMDDFTGLAFTENAEFSLERDAGTFRFTGGFEGPERRAEGDGRFSFTVSPAFVEDIEGLGTRHLDDHEILVMGAQNLRVQTVRELRDLGYGPFDGDELVTIAIFEVTPEFIAEMEGEGYEDLRLDTLVAMRVHGVDAEFVDDLRRAGIESDDEDDLIAWAVHDINPDYVEDIREQFGDGLDLDEIMALKIHGVDGAWARELEKAGFGHLDADELLSWKIHGVTPSYIREVRKMGYDLDEDELVAWRIHRVTEDFIDDLAELGYRNVDADDLVALRIHGATPRWIRHMHDRGLDDLDVHDLIRLRISGVEF